MRARKAGEPPEDRRIFEGDQSPRPPPGLVQSPTDEQGRSDDLGISNEELLSTNAALTSVNDHLHTRNQQVAQTNSDLRNVLVAVDLPIVIVDSQRRIRRFTPKARSILNVFETDRGRSIAEVNPNLDCTDLDGQIAEVIATATKRESEVRDRAGRWYRMQIRPYRTTDRKIDGAILTLVDIDELKRCIEGLDRARAAAERASREKDQFLANVSHELRSPLQNVLLRSQLLQRGATHDASVKRSGVIIERSAKMQIQLIDDLLDISRIAAGKLRVELRPVDLTAVAQAAVEDQRASADRKAIGIELEPAEAIEVAGEPTRLHQVISNLLTNAIKFTPPGGQIEVKVSRADGQALLSVHDSGIGIATAFLPNVFDRFAQQDGTDTGRQVGLGLGLAIVRELVQLHGGTVAAASPGDGLGATFSISLPLAPVERPADQAD